MAGTQWSESLCKLAVWLDALLTFGQTESVLAQVGQMVMSDSTAWRHLQKRGAQAQALEAARRLAATAAPDRQQIVPGEVRLTQRLAAAVDGGTPHLRWVQV